MLAARAVAVFALDVGQILAALAASPPSCRWSRLVGKIHPSLRGDVVKSAIDGIGVGIVADRVARDAILAVVVGPTAPPSIARVKIVAWAFADHSVTLSGATTATAVAEGAGVNSHVRAGSDDSGSRWSLPLVPVLMVTITVYCPAHVRTEQRASSRPDNWLQGDRPS